MSPATTDRPERHDREAILAELRTAGADTRRPNAIRCPFHADTNPSGGVYQDDAGIWRFKCHGCNFGGDYFDVRAMARGTSVADELRAGVAGARTPKAPAQKAARSYPNLDAMRSSFSHVAAVYTYTHPETAHIDLVVIRIEPPNQKKQFLQGHQTAVGPFLLCAPEGPLPLYNRRRLRKAELSDAVLVVEGEKCVHAVTALGILATTAPGGAGKAHLADWSLLAGRPVVLWPDNDEKGRDHMNDVARELDRLTPPATVSRIDPADLNLPPKGDVVEFIAASEHPAQEVLGVIDNATPIGPASGVLTRIEEAIAGRRESAPMPWNCFSQGTSALLPGSILVLVGNAGATKSLFMNQLLAFQHERGVRVAMFALEDDRDYHMMRALAQRSRKAGLTQPDWVKANAVEAREAYREHESFLHPYSRCIWESPEKPVPHAELLHWMEKRCAEGARVLCIDPITAAAPSREPWLDDQHFVTQGRKILRRAGASLILATHPRKNAQGRTSLDDLAGGAAFSRFTDTVAWLDVIDPPEEQSVLTAAGTACYTINRVLKIRKARNGRAARCWIALDFDPGSLTFQERGMVVR